MDPQKQKSVEDQIKDFNTIKDVRLPLALVLGSDEDMRKAIQTLATIVQSLLDTTTTKPI